MRVDRASRSSRVTVSTSPESRQHFDRFQPIGRESDGAALFRRFGVAGE